MPWAAWLIFDRVESYRHGLDAEAPSPSLVRNLACLHLFGQVSSRVTIAFGLALGLTEAVAALALGVGITRLAQRRPAPLVPTVPGKVSVGTPVSLDVPYSYRGLLVLVNRSRDAITLDGAGLARPGPGIAYVGAFVVHLPAHPLPCDTLRGRARRRCVQAAQVGVVHGYRIPWYGLRLKGAMIAPHAMVQVVVGVKATRPGRHRFDGITVSYHDGRGSYRTSYPYSARLCAPWLRYVNRCPGLLTVS
jgi:hypothetical protein